jgi:hypothetical protein
MLRSHGGRLGACNEPHAIFSHKKPKWDSDNCTGRAVGPGCPRGGDHVLSGWGRQSGPGSIVRRGSQVSHYTSVYRSITRVAAGVRGFLTLIQSFERPE